MPGDSPSEDTPLDRMSVAPANDARQDAGRDKSIAKRLEKNPDSADAQLDNALDESMDASDPPSNTQPGSGLDPAPSSAFDEEDEKRSNAD